MPLFSNKVYFTRTVDKDKLVELYNKLDKELPGNIAIKIHSGEEGNQNFLPPTFWKPLVDKLGDRVTVVECNTAYDGARNYTDKHMELLKKHEWSTVFPKVEILDKDGDISLPVENGYHLEENYIGRGLINYDSLIVLGHFKGHPCGGFGGALKQLSIGCASTKGKCLIHSAGEIATQDIIWEHMAKQDDFLESMADAAKTVVDLFQGNAIYINVMANMSVDCDCCAEAEDPCINDIGMLASLDPVALDKACVDLVRASDDPGKAHFLERVDSRNGEHTIDASADLGIGSKDYELIEF